MTSHPYRMSQCRLPGRSARYRYRRIAQMPSIHNRRSPKKEEAPLLTKRNVWSYQCCSSLSPTPNALAATPPCLYLTLSSAVRLEDAGLETIRSGSNKPAMHSHPPAIDHMLRNLFILLAFSAGRRACFRPRSLGSWKGNSRDPESGFQVLASRFSGELGADADWRTALVPRERSDHEPGCRGPCKTRRARPAAGSALLG